MSSAQAPYFNGFNFPFAFDPSTGGVAASTLTDNADQLIQQSIITILMTTVSEAVGNRSFGSNLKSSVFEPASSTLFPLIQYNVITALSTQEKRIQVVTVNVTQQSDANSGLNYIAVFVGYINLVTQKANNLTVQY